MARAPKLRALMLVVGTLVSACAAGDDVSGDVEQVNPTRGEALDMPPCGTVLGSFDGTNAYSNGSDTASGYSCAGTGAYGYQYQCVELVMRHFTTHWGLRWYGNAKDLLANAPGASIDVFDNGDSAHPPVPGDMIVWETGTWGHVALVTAVRADGIDILEQNVSGPGTATLAWDGATIGVRWGSWYAAGWAHARANGSAPDPGSGSGGSGTTGAGGGGSVSSSSATSGSGGGSSSGSGGGTPVDWNCANSAWSGQQYWTCSGGNIYRCDGGGVPVEQACAAGCVVHALGTDDACLAPAPGWNCANSAYAGQQYWTCSGGDLYRCEGGSPVEEQCSNGCVIHALGTDDACQ